MTARPLTHVAGTALIAALVVAGCGDSAEPDSEPPGTSLTAPVDVEPSSSSSAPVEPSSSSSVPVEPSSSSSVLPDDTEVGGECEPAASFAAVVGDLGITYDYEPSDSPVDLAASAEVVVRGSLTSLNETGEIEEGGNPYLIFSLDVSEIITGSVDFEVGQEVTIWVEFNRDALPFSEVEAAFPAGIDTVLFLTPFLDLGAWQPLVEGFFVGCGDRTFAATIAPSWELPGGLTDLVDAVGGA